MHRKNVPSAEGSRTNAYAALAAGISVPWTWASYSAQYAGRNQKNHERCWVPMPKPFDLQRFSPGGPIDLP